MAKKKKKHVDKQKNQLGHYLYESNYTMKICVFYIDCILGCDYNSSIKNIYC